MEGHIRIAWCLYGNPWTIDRVGHRFLIAAFPWREVLYFPRF